MGFLVGIISGFIGRVNLPRNVELHSFGKERGFSRVRRIWEFLALFSRQYAKADAVFFHMIPEFVIAASPLLISRKRPTGLWYVHKSKTMRLRLAELFVTYIFSASSMSFRYPSKKVIYTGHAIDTDLFRPIEGHVDHRNGLRIITVGRISPVKNIELLIKAAAIFHTSCNRPWSLSIVGGPVLPKDVLYLESLKELVYSLKLSPHIRFEGPRHHRDIPGIFREHDLFVSLSGTGSVDKAVLEAMSSGLTVLASNEAFHDILPPKYFLEKKSPEFLASRIRTLADEKRPNINLRHIVVRHHGLPKTTKDIIERLSRLP